jgi:hypothetical protein
VLRRLAIGLGVVVGLAVAAVAAVVIGLNGFIESNRERIVEGIAEGFARPVQVAHISAGFHGGVAMELEGLRVGDDPEFSSEPFISAERAHVIVRIWPLLRRRIEVRRIHVDAPHLNVIRTARGLNVDSLGKKPDAAAPSPAPSPSSGGGRDRTAAGVPAFAIALVSLDRGVVQWIDRTATPPRETTITPVSVRLSDLSLTTPMRIEVDAVTTGAPPSTFRLRGAMGPVGESPFAADVPIEQRIAIETPGLVIPELMVTGTVRRMPTGEPIAAVRAKAASVRVGGFELTGVECAGAEREGVAALDRLTFGVFGGTIDAKGRVDHTGDAPSFSFQSTVRGLDMAQALAARVPEMAERFDGRLDGDLTVSGKTGDSATVRRSLAGVGHVAIRDGRLHDVNVAEKVLTSATGIVGIVTLVPPRIRDHYPAIFATDDTRFQELSSDVRIGGQRIVIETMSVVAQDYAIHGRGHVTFAREMELTGTLVASGPFTADVLGVLREAKYLTNDAGLLAIPFRLTGVLPNVRAKPDADFVGRALQRAIAGEDLDKLLGGDGSGKKAKKAEDAIKKGLDKLFRR